MMAGALITTVYAAKEAWREIGCFKEMYKQIKNEYGNKDKI